jgi:hypothetical protein
VIRVPLTSPRLPSPGPSFVREESVPLATPGARATLGMTPPSTTEDGWWLTTVWAEDGDGVIEARAVAPVAGPPPGAPLQTLGPTFAGAMSGLVDQENGRQLVRLRMPAAEDELRPWERPLIMWVAVRWDPVRTATLRPNELARELLRAFARAVESAGKPW